MAQEPAPVTVRKGLVLDANILIRAVAGRRVWELLKTYEDAARFYAPDVCFEDSRQYVPGILKRCGRDPQAGLAVLDQMSLLVQPVDRALYQSFESPARERVAGREPRTGQSPPSPCC